MPKFNMYQSLHTTVIGPEGKPVEVQIRTQKMHRQAEYGIAAHWKYKEQYGGQQDMTWLRQLVDWQRETQDPGEFLDSLRFDLHAQEVFVFTPKGDVIALPASATPVDFAYSVHTEVGHRCIGARVNGRLVPLESTLDNGDVVEIFTSKAETAGPATPTRGQPRARPAGDPGVVVKGEPDVWVKLARCCTPVPGDDIVGFVTRGSGVSVHRDDCSNVEHLSHQPDRLLEVEW